MALQRFKLPRSRPLMHSENPANDVCNLAWNVQRLGSMAKAHTAAVFKDRDRRAESFDQLFDRPANRGGPPAYVGDDEAETFAVRAQHRNVVGISAGCLCKCLPIGVGAT